MDGTWQGAISTLRAAIGGIPREWLLSCAAAALATTYGGFLYAIWRVRTIHKHVKLLAEDLQRIRDLQENTTAEYQRQALIQLRATQFYLQHINEKVASLLPPDVKVGSISAENLVVGPTAGHGQRAD